MRFYTHLLCCLFIPAVSIAQVSDFITVKKRNNRTLKSYFPGSAIACETIHGNYFNGFVEAVRNDSVFIKQYDIRALPSMWGVSKIDTVSSFISGIHYKDIRLMNFERRQSFGYIRSGALFIIGGAGYAGLNLVNGKYLGEPITEKRNLRKLGIALGAVGGGFLIRYLNNRSHNNEKKYRVEYIRMNTVKPKGA